MDLTVKNRKIKKIVGLIVIAIIALLHIFRIGSYLDGFRLSVYYSYFSDLLIPFNFIDIVMYCTVVAFAIVLEWLKLKRIIPLWD